MRKLITMAIVFVIAAVCCTSGYAEQRYSQSPYVVHVDSIIRSNIGSSTLTISGTTATCKSQYLDIDETTSRVVITQTLEKHSFLWFWDTVGGEWTKTLNGNAGLLTNKVYGLSSGTYRVKSVFEITLEDGTYETFTIYSVERTVA